MTLRHVTRESVLMLSHVLAYRTDGLLELHVRVLEVLDQANLSGPDDRLAAIGAFVRSARNVFVEHQVIVEFPLIFFPR